MGFLDLTSNKSMWKGYDYFKEGKVVSCEQTGTYNYKGTVKGSGEEVYDVTLDIDHPKRSVCNCPHADGKRRICKHKVAMYFSLFPEEAERIVREAEEWEAAEGEREQERYDEIKKYVYSLSKQDLRDELIYRMMNESNNTWY